jgi:hypothetical protein
VINRALQRLRISGRVDLRHGGGRQRHTTPAQTQYVSWAEPYTQCFKN